MCCLIILRLSLCGRVIVWLTHNRLLRMGFFWGVLPSFVVPPTSYFRKLASFALASILPTIHLFVVIHQTSLFDFDILQQLLMYFSSSFFLIFLVTVTVCDSNSYLFSFAVFLPGITSLCWYISTVGIGCTVSSVCLYRFCIQRDAASVLLATTPSPVVPCYIFWIW